MWTCSLFCCPFILQLLRTLWSKLCCFIFSSPGVFFISLFLFDTVTVAWTSLLVSVSDSSIASGVSSGLTFHRRKYSLNIWSNCLLLQQERRPHDAQLPVPVRQKNVHSVNTVAKTRGCAWEIDLSHKFLPSSPLVQMKGHGFEIGLGWRWMGQQYLRWKVIRISSSLGGFSSSLFGILIYSPCPSQDSLQVSANLQQAWLREIAFGNKGFCNEPNFWLKLLASLCILFLHSQN